jgi:hypothetical protein
MRYLSIICISLVLLAAACNKKKLFAGPNSFQDDFESYENLEAALQPDDQLWSYTQLTRSTNTLTIDTTFAHSGTHSLKFSAQASDGEGASKASISKQKMAFWEGETLRMKAWYFLEGTESRTWLFLMDLEEQASIGAGPGMRLALVDNRLRVEHKYNEKDILQVTEGGVEFPRNEWVELVWEVKLSKKNKGTVKLWQNGILIINSSGNKTLPTDILYFQQGTKGMYSSCEIGITANSKEGNTNLWVDDFSIEKLP